MGNISVEQKLNMLHQLRARYDNDRTDLMRREQILYGQTSPVHSSEFYNSQYQEEGACSNTSSVRGTFRIRFLAAIVLVLLLILTDRKDKDFFGVSTSEIYTLIEEDYITQLK